MAYLQLSSETASQKLVIGCRYYDPGDKVILLGDGNQALSLNATDSVLVVIDVLENSCSVSLLLARRTRKKGSFMVSLDGSLLSAAISRCFPHFM